MQPLTVTLLAMLALVLTLTVAWYNLLRLRQARAAMRQALAAQGDTLLTARLCWLPTGPFRTEIAMHQPVYRVTVRDREGHERSGWVRCRPFSDRTELAWEDPPAST